MMMAAMEFETEVGYAQKISSLMSQHGFFFIVSNQMPKCF